jgi:glycine cleavage system H lipoate-binding protein
MRCPFIREATVRSCGASSFRTMIPGPATEADGERCSSPDYVRCSAFLAMPAREAGVGRCPFLQETFVEYCSAAAVTKYIPAAGGLLPRCKSERHRYCEIYLGEADPFGERLPGVDRGRGASTRRRGPSGARGIPVPANLSYAPNHMWLDVASDGCCHVGVDAFLTWVVGSVRSIAFVNAKVVDRPVAVLTVNGVDLQLVFPKLLEGIVPNTQLRTDPSRVTSDPYGAGWLFEATVPTHAWSPSSPPAEPQLIGGEEAAWWFGAETDRLTTFVHDRISRPGPSGLRVMADGGRVEPGVAAYLGRDDLVNLFNEFFSPLTALPRSW